MPQSSHNPRRSAFRHDPPPGGSVRLLAGVLCLILALASVGPGFVRAAELESEGEGSAPSGAAAGLGEEPGYEPSGEETALEAAPPPLSTEIVEEAPTVVSPTEAEPPPAPEVASAPEAPVEASSPTLEVAPPSAPPTYEPETEPSYEPAPTSAAPVENQTIVAPPTPTSQPRPLDVQEAAPAAVPEAPAPVPPPEAPEPTPPPPATPSMEGNDDGGSLAGHRFHTVRPGESLWSIATALLPPGAGNVEVAAEVTRLWRLNEHCIGTGDPNLILAGTVLRLR